MEQEELIRTDKNGTQYFMVTARCSKCGGSGYIQCYSHIDDGECWDCRGTGFITFEEKRMLPEYEAKLNARRQLAQEKKDAERKAQSAGINKVWLAKNGFNDEGNTYVFLGNTYIIKDELKAEGAQFGYPLGWNSPENINNRPALLLNYKEVTSENWLGILSFNDIFEVEGEEVGMVRWLEYRKAQLEKVLNPTPESQYVGEVGKRQDFDLIYDASFSYESSFGYVYIHKLHDEAGNIFVWKTGSMMMNDDGSYFKAGIVKATVKEHAEYKGIKQTVLTRCKF